MIDVKELRIGNFVNFFEDDTVFKVTEIAPDGLRVENDTEETWIEIDQFEPFKITEEWLLKLGFSWQKYYPHFGDEEDDVEIYNTYALPKEGNKAYYYTCTINPNDCIEFAVESEFNEHEFVLARIKYVHQLQNVYFAVTGEELCSTL